MTANALKLLELAWGNQDGFVFLSERDPSLSPSDPGYWTDHPYRWPSERYLVEDALQQAEASPNDMYWSPGVFSKDTRRGDNALPSDTLWSDLDEANPAKLPKELKPAAYWQTSPGRWQAIWKLPEPVSTDSHRRINQALTYEIGADKGGWGLSKVLRIPDTPNHKYEDEPKVKLEKLNGRRVRLSSVTDLIAKASTTEAPLHSGNGTAEESYPDPRRTLRAKRVSPRTRRLLQTKRSQVHVGERSERLWELECGLAEAGWTAEEIVGAVRGSAWNKFAGRANELGQLTNEANKAIEYTLAKGPPSDLSRVVIAEGVEEDDDDELPQPVTWSEFDKDHSAITWLVQDVWADHEVGFVSGAPKSYKSWVAVDLVVSIATGTPFLGEFRTRQAPVLLIQEEDPRSVLQDRLVKVAGAKDHVWAKLTNATTVKMRYELPDNLFVISNQGFTLAQEEHLDELESFVKREGIEFVLMDPLMMIAGGQFDEFKAFEVMENVLKPLKRVRAKTGCGIALVHHHTKGAGKSDAQAMYGSVAFWAWEEAALHMHTGQPGLVTAERFSKHTQLQPLSISVGDTSVGWEPNVQIGVTSTRDILDLLSQYQDGISTPELAQHLGVSRDVLSRELNRMQAEGKVDERPGQPRPGTKGRRPKLWVIQ